ncbi:MAG: trypsin-like serine protease [Gammaproteobacteria bacterium]|nr:trypsin-like serine protease [Gammaproteobacteria bacterium]
MKIKTIKLLGFIVKSITMGMIAALFLFVFFPHLIQPVPEVIEEPELLPLSFAEAIKATSPSVVNIRTIYPERQKRSNQLVGRMGYGSGVIISPEGYVVTNYHVISKAKDIAVRLTDGRQAIAELIGVDPETDLAVLKVPMNNLIPLVMDSSVKVDVGDVALVIGNPFGADQSVSMGIVSGTGRRFIGLSNYENFIQTDAAVNPGNSGGALINARGDFLGISSAHFTRGKTTGISYAIPMAIAMDVTQEIINNGKVIRGWLGFNGGPINLIGREIFGEEVYLVTAVSPDGPADSAGFKKDDIIRKVNNLSLGPEMDLQNLIAISKPDSEIIFEIERNKQILQLTAIVKERPIPE